MSDDNNHWKLENLFHSTLKTRAQPFFTVHCCQFTLKIDNIHGNLWIQSFKLQKPFFTNQGRADSAGLPADASVCFDFIKADILVSSLLPIHFENRQYSQNSLDSKFQISKTLFSRTKAGPTDWTQRWRKKWCDANAKRKRLFWFY